MSHTPIQLSAPIVAAVLEQPDGELVEYTVQTDNRDAIQWDVIRAKRDWPKGEDAPFLWLTFMAWHAMKRTGSTQLKLDEFLGKCAQASSVKKDGTPAGAGDSLVDPTQPAAASD